MLGQQIIIENVGGAGGMVGSARVAKAPPDGYTIVLGSRADAINQTLYKKPAYNLLEDLVPVVLIADQPTILITPNEFPANTMPEFIDYVKKNQATMKVASAGAGSTGMIDCQLLNAAIGVNVTHVPYRGGGPAMQDIIGGRVDYICTLTGSVVPLVEGKTVKAIAVLTKERAPMLPNVKSSWEQGFKDLEASTWFSFMAPKGTPEAVIKKLHDATVDGDGGQRGAEADAGVGRDHRAAGAALDRISAGLHGEGDREERRADPRRRPVDRVTASVRIKRNPGRPAGVFVSVCRREQRPGVLFGGPPQAAHHDHRHPEQEWHVSLVCVGSWRDNASSRRRCDRIS